MAVKPFFPGDVTILHALLPLHFSLNVKKKKTLSRNSIEIVSVEVCGGGYI